MSVVLQTRLLALAAILGLASCGGGGGGPPSTSPAGFSISNLSYSPIAAYASPGGQVTVTGSVRFANAAGGVSSLTIDTVDSTGAIVSSTTTPISNGAGVSAGTGVGSVVAGTSVAGDYTVRVTMRDVAGNVSNPLTGGFRVSVQPWVAKAPMPNARDYFAVAGSGGLAYVLGGETSGTGTPGSGTASSVVDVYDPAMDSWSPGVALPTARTAPVAASVNGVIYVIGGFATNPLSTVEAFNPATMQWTSMAPMPTARYAAAAAVMNGAICVLGGLGSTAGGLAVLATAECFDPVSNTWSPKPGMSAKRWGLGADSLGGLAYAAGGFFGGQHLTAVERFDLATQTWSTASPLITGRDNAAVVAAAGLLFAMGGGKDTLVPGAIDAVIADVEAFNPSTGTWIAKTPMPSALTRLGALTMGSAIFVFGAGDTLQYTPANDIL